VDRRGLFDLHTVPGIVRTGLLVGLLWGLALVVLARVTEATRWRSGARPLAGAPLGPTPPFLFPIVGVAPASIGEGFDARRGLRRHEAVDVAAPRGTPVRAVADGTVRLTRHVGAGLTVEHEEASGRYCLVYAHLDSYVFGLRDDAAVIRGQTIGYVGTTGNAPPNVPHLHFAVHLREGGGCWSGAAVDPVPLFGPAGS
jgi:murein DD-endopeptidase MepM/ murein hydrolase activator NlpD